MSGVVRVADVRFLQDPPVSSKRVRRAPRVAIGVSFARHHEAVPRHRVAGLGAETRSEPAHWRVPVLFATRDRVSLDVTFLVVVADLVSMCRLLLGVSDPTFAAYCTMACSCELTRVGHLKAEVEAAPFLCDSALQG